MSPNKKKLLNELSISEHATLLQAIKQMDALDRKLLLVVSAEGAYRSLLSIGDVQRYLIQHQNIEAPVAQALRNNVRVSRQEDSYATIKRLMLEFRTEFMPLLDEQGKLVDIILWKELFQERTPQLRGNLNLPVVIMAGGKGTRLKPVTDIIPKPLVPLGDKPIIEVIVDRFVRTGTTQFFFSVNYKSEMIRQYFDQLKEKRYTIEYLQEPEPLGTAGSLHLLKTEISTSFFVSNCDILIDQDYEEIYRYHREGNNLITLVAAIKHFPIAYGTVETDTEGLLREIKEKPELTLMVNAGLYILEPELLRAVPENQFYHITDLIRQVKADGGRVGVFPVSERAWSDIGEWKEYHSAVNRYRGRTTNLINGEK